MKVLFLYKNENFLCPTGICTLSAVLKKAGHETFFCEINSADPFEAIEKISPGIVAYSSSTGESKYYLSLNSRIKEKFPGVFSLMGSHHPTFFPDVVDCGGLDAVCVGEGEYALCDLADALENNRAVEGIPNIVTTKNRDSFELRPLIENLDELPFPDFSLVYDNTPLGQYPLKSVITSRGCPFSCTYCFNKAWRELYRGKGSAFRRHSVDYVIEQIKYIRSRWPLSFVKFYDDVFTFGDRKWLEEFCEKYPKQVGLPFFILTRCELVDEDLIRMLKQAGCRTCSMSIEAGNPTVRSEVLNRRGVTDEQIINAHLLCEKYGIFTFTNSITGIPDTAVEDDIMSLDLAIKSHCTWGEFPIFFPFPGTQLGNYAVEKGYYKPDYGQMHTSYQYKTPLGCFDAKTVNAQMNFSVLGPVVVVFPWLRGVFLRYLLHMPNNRVFTFVYYVVKMWVLRSKIYVTKTSFWGSMYIFFKSLKQEIFRHTAGK